MKIKVNVVSTEQTNGLMGMVTIGVILILGVSWATRIRLILCDCFGWENIVVYQGADEGDFSTLFVSVTQP